MTATGLYSGKKSMDKKAQALNSTKIRKGIEANPPNIYMYFLSAFIQSPFYICTFAYQANLDGLKSSRIGILLFSKISSETNFDTIAAKLTPLCIMDT